MLHRTSQPHKRTAEKFVKGEVEMKLLNTNERAAGGALPMPHSSLDIAGLVEETERICPECGAPMAEFDRLTEDSAVFIWYACTRESCTGQWLTKKALRMCGA
jgi:hypothetical protein